MSIEDYPEVYRKLIQETAIVKFIKADGTKRIMLATRNIETSAMMGDSLLGLLGGYDKRCNRHNGNIAVIDLALVNCRSFNIERVIDIEWCGVIEKEDELSKVIDKFRQSKESFNIEESGTNSMDSIGKIEF